MGAPRMPRDREILKKIYNRYYDTFAGYSRGDSSRRTKIYVPIDIDAIAAAFGVDGDLIFGQLYYHLNKKYGYKQDDGSLVFLFTPGIPGSKGRPDDRHCVNFPLLASVMAELESEFWKFVLENLIAGLALIVSIVALVFSLQQRFILAAPNFGGHEVQAFGREIQQYRNPEDWVREYDENTPQLCSSQPKVGTLPSVLFRAPG